MVEQVENSTALRILQQRAEALAALEQAADGTHGEEHVFFGLGTQTYGVPARAVREIQPLRRYTALPQTPPYLVGLVNVRGRLLAALDLRPLLDAVPAAPLPGAMLILLSVDGVEVGLLADVVYEIRAGEAELGPTLSAASGRAVSWLRGIDSQLNLVIDPAGLLADPRLYHSPKGA